MCYIAFHCDVMSLSFLCAFVTLNKKITYLLTYLLVSRVNECDTSTLVRHAYCVVGSYGRRQRRLRSYAKLLSAIS